MAKFYALGTIAVLGLSMLVFSGCSKGDESGASLVKPNPAQANRYKQGNKGGPPAGQPPAGVAANNVP